MYNHELAWLLVQKLYFSATKKWINHYSVKQEHSCINRATIQVRICDYYEVHY